jgi:hypothetical protein
MFFGPPEVDDWLTSRIGRFHVTSGWKVNENQVADLMASSNKPELKEL